jgi:branched-chain amino acid transport system ATP-binding protein
LPLLETRDVVVRFGGVTAVDSASLSVEAGAVTGLIGPNGAGKTTMFNVITGLQPPTEGTVHLDGEDITGLPPQRRAHRGIGRTFQRLEVFGSLTVRENLIVAAEIREQWSAERDESADVAADRLLDLIGIRGFADQPADAVPTGIARLTELGRALATRPRVLLLDEPSSGLTEEETGDFAALLRTLAGDGLAILIVEHDVDLVMSLCSTIHVLDFGRVIASGPPAAVQADPAVQAAYLGADVADTPEVPA